MNRRKRSFNKEKEDKFQMLAQGEEDKIDDECHC